MATCADIITEISAQLHGYGGTQDRVTPLSADIGPSDSTFTVDFTAGAATGIMPGVVEIDSEQLYVVAVDQTNGTVTVANGFGRGYNNTTPAAHSAGAKVISRPKFSRDAIFKQINEVIGGLFPDIFVPKTYTTSVKYPSNSYTMPDSPIVILDVQWQDPIGNWQRHSSYTVDSYDHAVRLGSGAMIGRPIRFLYGTEPAVFAAETDDLVTATGIPASCKDLLVMGVVARMLPTLDIGRAQPNSVEQTTRSKDVPPQSGIQVGRFLMAEYQERLKNESVALRRQYKIVVRRVW